MKQLEVQILQQSYLLGCPEGREARMLEAVRRVDMAMTTIRDAGKVRSRERIAVLAALNIAFDLGERENEMHAAAAAAPQTQPESGVPLSDSDNARIAALVQRMDEVLGSDQQLF